MDRVEFGNGLRSHIAREPEPQLGEAPLGPAPQPVPDPEPVPQSTSAEWVRDLLRERVGEQAERIVGGSNADDLIIGPVPLAQLSLDDSSRLRVVIDDQQDWRTWHGRHL